jgi:exoribonuclease II
MNVFYEEDGGFKVASVMSETGGALQVESVSGKRSKIKAGNVLLRFESALASFMDEANAEAENLEVPFLWECCGESEFGFEVLAQEYYGHKPNAVQSAAVAMRLHSAPIYFYRKGKGQYKAAPPDTLKAALAAVEKKRLQAEQIQNWVEQLKAKQMPEALTARLDMLLYAPDKNSMEWKAVEQASNELHINPVQMIAYAGGIESNHDYHLGAFLRECFAYGAEFPSDLPLADLPQDLPKAEVKAFSIDDSTTTEIDDAFSVQTLADGAHRVGIHIAAPALGIAPHSALDEVALKRLSTVYMPGNKITMLPVHAITPFSLDGGQWKPALSMYFDVASDLTISNRHSKVELIEVVDNLRHDSLEPYFNEDTLAENNGHPYWEKLSLLFNLAESFEKARGKHDPNRPIQIDYSFYVEDGKVRIVGRRRGSPMDKLVAELMIEANSQWGALLAEHQVPGIYRAQNGGRVYMTTQAEPHQGLGVAQYAWSTSPLRRAVDLVNQRQIIAVVQEKEPAYASNDDELAMIMRHFDLTYSAYGDFQTRMERYWCLQFLVQENIQEISATVWRENLVRLDHMPYITKVFNLPELPVGTRVLLEVKRVDTLMMELDARFKSVEETTSQAAEVLVDDSKGVEEVL